jgi:hypothetical protein
VRVGGGVTEGGADELAHSWDRFRGIEGELGGRGAGGLRGRLTVTRCML